MKDTVIGYLKDDDRLLVSDNTSIRNLLNNYFGSVFNEEKTYKKYRKLNVCLMKIIVVC